MFILLTNILYAFIMYMFMYGYMNAFKIKLFEISYIKWIEIICHSFEENCRKV